MCIAEIILLGIALSMDAFAAAMCKGISMKKWSCKFPVVIGLFFGTAQMLMPILGVFLGNRLKGFISSLDHWIAFALLGGIGAKMIYDAYHDKKPEITLNDKIDLKEISALSLATSIDALTVGITFSFLNVNVMLSSLIIGCTTFILSCMGVCIGYLFGTKFEKYSSYAGGTILIFIGINILIKHTLY